MALKYFTDANSGIGYVNIQGENLSGIDNIYHLESPNTKVVDRVLNVLLSIVESQKIIYELVYSAFSPDELAGIIMREKSVAFVSGPNSVNGAQIIDLSSMYDEDIVFKNSNTIAQMTLGMAVSYQKAHGHLAAALEIHDEWERFFQQRMDFEAAQKFQEEFIVEFFESAIPASTKVPVVAKRFFGAFSSDGLVEFIPELTDDLKRYLIKGQPGTGKSTFMRGILAKALELGYDVDEYQCSLDPESLDMIVIPELDVCFFDATAPHEYEASRPRDEIIDLYRDFTTAVTVEEAAADTVTDIAKRYYEQIDLAKTALKNATAVRNMINDLYNEAVLIVQLEELLFWLRKIAE